MLGIDIGSYSIKAAVVKKTGRGATIEQVASELLPENKRGGAADQVTLQQAVNKLLKKVGRGQSSVSLSIPTSSVILKTLEMDASLKDDFIEGEVQMELVNFVPFPLDQVYADFISTGKSTTNPDKQNVFVVASRRDIVDKIANTVNAKTIKSKAVDVEAFAVGQILEQIKGKNYREVYGVIDVGYQTSTVSIFKSGELIFYREQQIGGQHLTEAIADATGTELVEAENNKLNNIHGVAESIVSGYLDSLSEQVSLALEFFGSANEHQVEAFYLTGGGSLVPGTIENLTENLPNNTFKMLPIGQDIKIGNKTNGMSHQDIASGCAVVAGLAMRK